MYRTIAEFGYHNFAVFTFTLYFRRSCMVKCKGIPKFISQSQIPVVLCFEIYLRSFEGDSITLLQGH